MLPGNNSTKKKEKKKRISGFARFKGKRERDRDIESECVREKKNLASLRRKWLLESNAN